MFATAGPARLLRPFFSLICALAAGGCTQVTPESTAATGTAPSRPATAPRAGASALSAPAPLPAAPVIHPVMLGIDVLEEMGFAPLHGKRVGLLTHRAGVNRRGEQSIDVLRRAPDVRLVALYSVEHGLYGDLPANQRIPDHTDARTGLPVFSLYNGVSRKPSPQQLAGIDTLVIDLQDIGTRSYTYVSAMRLAVQACFEQNKEVVVLDRPNPLGGLKVDGPPLDREWMSYVGAFRVPYVHGLTIGELARWCAQGPGVLDLPEEVRQRGRLTVIPMKGWRRSMRWPETGLTFVPTSPFVQDFAACVGYAMTGLGCQLGGFTHGLGRNHPFRTLGFRGQSPEALKRTLESWNLPGLNYHIVSALDPQGKPVRGVYIEIADWNAWRPTELSFYLMRQACVWNPPNPFAAATRAQMELFNKHTGSTAWWNALVRDGAQVDVARFVSEWQERAGHFQTASRRYWLYPP
jgi:uncharacterized protein YbbC (DUF1343 family)